jgi:hypothetical protein
MSNLLVKTTAENTVVPSPQAVYQQTAPNSKQFFANVGEINETHIYYDDEGEKKEVALSTEYCNIFVVKNESFSSDKGSFKINKERTLQRKNTIARLREKYADLSSETAAEIYTFPSLFMDTNHSGKFKVCSQEQQFFYGIVTKIEEQGRDLKIHYRKRSGEKFIKQQLYSIESELKLNKDSRHDSLDETHWSIKEVNLRKVLAMVELYT